jgi:hypothetical protein
MEMRALFLAELKPEAFFRKPEAEAAKPYTQDIKRGTR